MPAKVGKEFARHIQPTRKHADTEYNLEYKRWPTHYGSSYKEVQNSLNKGKLVKAGRIWSSSRPKSKQNRESGKIENYRTNKEKSKEQVSRLSATCGSSDSYKRQVLMEKRSKDKQFGDSLRASTAHLHTRPVASQVNTSTRSEPLLEEGECPNHRVKKAWISREEDESYQKSLQNDISAKIRFLKSASHTEKSKSLPESDITKKSQNNTDQCKSPRNENAEYPFTGRTSNCSLSTNGLPSPKRTNSFIIWKPYSPMGETKESVPRLMSGVKALRTPQSSRQKKLRIGDGIDEENLRKIYTNATDEELHRLKKTFRSILGSSHSRERVVRKQYSSLKNEIPPGFSERGFTRDDLDQVRVAAFRASKNVKEPSVKDSWETSYRSDYCNKIFAIGDGRIARPSKDSTNKGQPLPQEKKIHKKNQKEESDQEKKGEMKETEKQSSESSQTTKDEEKTPDQEDKIMSKYTRSEAEKILKEANEIEEREFAKKFLEDGKPKMNFETTSQSTFKGGKCPKRDEPVWANKTMVSLGSGHWNLLLDHYDGWDTQNETSENVSTLVPQERKNEAKYKIKVHEGRDKKKEPELKVEDVETKEKGLNIYFMTEYMSKFTAQPLPKKIILI